MIIDIRPTAACRLPFLETIAPVSLIPLSFISYPLSLIRFWKQRQLVQRLAARAPRPHSRRTRLRFKSPFQLGQHFLAAANHLRRNPGHPRDVYAVTLVRRAWDDLVKKHDLGRACRTL